MVIGISGKMQSGKDTVGKIIQYFLTVDNPTIKEFINRHINNNDVLVNPKWTIKRYGDKLKQIISLLTGIPVEDLEKIEVKNRVLGEEWWFYGYGEKEKFESIVKCPYLDSFDRNSDNRLNKLTVRDLLQGVGTNAMRDIIHPNIWVNALFADYWTSEYEFKPNIKDFKIPVYINDVKNSEHEWKKYIKLGDNIKYHNGYGWSRHIVDDFTLNRGFFPTGIGNETATLGYNNFTHPMYLSKEEDLHSYPNWIITDVRFPNELDAIEDREGFVIRINRHLFCKECNYCIKRCNMTNITSNDCFNCAYYPEYLEVNNHESETALDNHIFDNYIDNNGTIEELVKQVKEILIKHKLL